MSDKYEDCASCAFSGQDHVICDQCEDADQWELDEYEDEDSLVMISKPKIIKFHKKEKSKDDYLERMVA
jgi:hypothetical protein